MVASRCDGLAGGGKGTPHRALERTQPGLPLGIGHIRTKTHDYVRHGTLALFAALNYLEGKLITRLAPPINILPPSRLGPVSGWEATSTQPDRADRRGPITHIRITRNRRKRVTIPRR